MEDKGMYSRYVSFESSSGNMSGKFDGVDNGSTLWCNSFAIAISVCKSAVLSCRAGSLPLSAADH
eukprot:1998156-Pyramimonas_sp.AAC.1